jgi:hypothetical protein
MSLEESWEKAINDRPAGSAQQPPTTPIADDVWDRALDAPTQLIRDPWSTFPPLLDRYGATKAAPFTGTELQGFRGASDRIASFYGPQLLTQESMRIQREYGEKAMQKTRGEAAPINMANVRVKFGSRAGEDEEEASSPLGTVSNPLTDVGLSFNESLGVKTFFADKRKMPDTAHARDLKCINRYHQYMTHCIPEDEIEEFNEEWAGNMLVRLTQSSIFSLPDEILGGTSEDYLQKTRENYKHAVAKAILDYVLMNPTERRRLELLNPPVDNATVLTPHPQRLTAVPHSWFEFVGEARDAFESSSTLCEPSLLQVLGLWQEFHDLLTVDIPEVTDSVKVITIDEFEAMQNNHRDEVKQTFKNRWHTAVAKAIRSNTLVNMALLESDAPAAQRNLKMTQSIFESLATLMVAQLRGVVTRSVQAYLELFQGYKLNVKSQICCQHILRKTWRRRGKLCRIQRQRSSLIAYRSASTLRWYVLEQLLFLSLNSTASNQLLCTSLMRLLRSSMTLLVLVPHLKSHTTQSSRSWILASRLSQKPDKRLRQLPRLEPMNVHHLWSNTANGCSF